MKYFRNDKLDLVNKEKQRFGFRKLSSGKIASVLLGVTIFGSFALNGQVVKANTTTDGSHSSLTITSEGGEETTKADQGNQDTQTADTTSGSEAEIGKTKTDSTGTNTQNANRGGIQPLI